MIRVTMVFSVVVVSLLTSACAKENKKAPAPAVKSPQQPMLNGQQQPTGGATPQGSTSSGGNGIQRSGDVEQAAPQVKDRVSQVRTDNGDEVEGGASAEPVDLAKPPAPAVKEAAVEPPARPAQSAATQELGPEDTSTAPPADTSTVTTTTTTKPPASLQQAAPDQNAAPDLNLNPVLPKTPEVAEFTLPLPPISPTLYTTVHADDPKWAPGLAREPAPAPKSTGLENFTDASDDGLMDQALAGMHRDADLQKSNKELSESIATLQLVTINKKAFTLAVDLEVANSKSLTRLVFSGSRQTVAEKESSSKQKTKSKLPADYLLRSFELHQDAKSSSQGLIFKYRAHVYCSDETQATCQNAVVEIRKYDLNGKKPIAKAFVVHRLGSAIVTFVAPGTKQVDGKVIEPSPSLREFNQYLKDSALNICIGEKSQSKKDLARLQPLCPQSKKLAIGASDSLYQTWAAAEGRAGYSWILANHEDAKDVYFQKSLVIKGALVMPNDPAQATAFVEDRSKSNRDQLFKEIQLVNADGAGALVLQIKYADQESPQKMTEQRISITPNFLKTHAPKPREPQVSHQKKSKPTVTTQRQQPRNKA